MTSDEEVLNGLKDEMTQSAPQDDTFVALDAFRSQVVPVLFDTNNEEQQSDENDTTVTENKSLDLDNVSFKGNETTSAFKDLAQLYGNNLFELSVENTNLFGVLKEIPKLTMSTTWNPNTPASIINSLQKLVSSNTKLQVINSIFGVPQMPWIAAGNATTHSYVGCSESSFDLQFRVYSQEAIGPGPHMSGYTRILAALCIYAPPLHTFDADSALSLSIMNLGKSAAALLGALDGVVDFANEKLNGVPLPDGSTPEGKKVKQAIKDTWNFATDFGSAMLNAIGAENSNDRQVYLKNAGTAIENMCDKAQLFLNDEGRVKNDKERVESSYNWYGGMYGGALWHLSILPGVFKYRIPVYVKNWSAKPSKEIDNAGRAAYVDFTVTCVMDQIKTGTWWTNMIYAPEGDAYKNRYKEQVKEPN